MVIRAGALVAVFILVSAAFAGGTGLLVVAVATSLFDGVTPFSTVKATASDAGTVGGAVTVVLVESVDVVLLFVLVAGVLVVMLLGFDGGALFSVVERPTSDVGAFERALATAPIVSVDVVWAFAVAAVTLVLDGTTFLSVLEASVLEAVTLEDATAAELITFRGTVP